jgi:eukaryotic-like serine/threonine-protein kinase
MSDSPRNGANGKPAAAGTTPVTLLDDEAAPPVPAAAPRAAAAERYVIDREIGHGGMGRVFSGRDLRLGRTVAIKMLRTQDAALASRFEREVKLAARLQHPGVVPVYDAGFWPSGQPFLVMKLVLGQSLARVIKDADTHADRLALLPQVIAAAEAMAYAHDQGIVHRDLKPNNILVGAFGETVVLDWGLAKDLRAGSATEASAAESGLPSPQPSPESGRGGSDPAPSGRGAGDTAAGAVIGTPSYMSPEQAAGRPVDPRADVYALGAILYYVLTGTAPQPASTSTDPSAAPAGLVPLVSLEPRLPPDLLAIVDKALAADAACRYPSAFELADDLKRFAGGQLVAARRYSALTRAGRFAARHPGAVAVATAALLAATAALALR